MNSSNAASMGGGGGSGSGSGVGGSGPSGLAASDSFYKRSLELARQHNSKLRTQLEQLERENRDLKKSLYHISYDQTKAWTRFRMKQPSNSESRPVPFDINAALSGSHLAGPSTGDAGPELYSSRKFLCKSTLKSHRGAIYALQYSPCGRMLASGSFDGTTRIWDAENPGQKVPLCLSDNQRNVVSLDWLHDSSRLVAGSYDGSIKLWDVESESVVASFSAGSVVQSVRLAGAEAASAEILFAACSNRQASLVVFDSRINANTSTGIRPCKSIQTDSVVNSLYVYKDARIVLSGDHAGFVKAISVSDERVLSSVSDSGGSAISYLCASRPALADAGVAGDVEGQFLSVNSYDSVLRVYDRESFLVRRKREHTDMQSKLSLVHQLRGHQNRGWPIKSSFFQGRSYQGRASWKSERTDELDLESSENHRESLDSSLLVASGSVDGKVYVYDASGPQGTASLLQRLDGHRDRVNAVDFHPREPVLASASADFTVRIWAPN